MSKHNEKRNKRRKALSAVLAVAMALTMLLSGTLAYFYQSRAVNKISGEVKKNVIGHDDFTKVVTEDGTVKYDKNVYVENLGAGTVYVRVKLSEDFTLEDQTITADADGNLTPVTHIPAAGGDSAAIGTGDKDTAAEGELHSYFTWDMGTATGYDQSKTYYKSAKADAYHDDVDEDGNPQEDPTPDIFIKNGVAQDNSGKVYTKNDMGVNPLWFAPVITMQEYMRKTQFERENYYGWVIDNTKAGETFLDSENKTQTENKAGDGWAYWSQMLGPGDTTGLLLNGVTVSNELKDKQFDYRIYADFEVVDETDKGIWFSGDIKQASNWDRNFTDEEVTSMKIKTKGAIELLENAKLIGDRIYTPEVTELVNSISKQAESAKSAISQNFYASALSNAKASADNIFAKKDAMEFAAAAKELDEMEDDPAQRAYLESTVLEVTTDESGEPKLVTGTNSGRMNNMDPTIAQYIVKKYGDGMKLTGRQAMSVTGLYFRSGSNPEWKQGSDYLFTNWKDVTKENFKNLRELVIVGGLDESFSTSNFVIKHGDEIVSSIKSLNIYDQISRTTYPSVTCDLSCLKDLNSLSFNIKADYRISGMENLKKLKYLYWKIDRGVSVSLTDFNSLLNHCEEIQEVHIFNGIYETVTSDEGTTTNEALSNCSKLDFSKCTKLQCVTMGISGKLDLHLCEKLIDARPYYGSVFIYVKDKTRVTSERNPDNVITWTEDVEF